MRKLLILAIAFVLAFAASWVADHAGNFSLQWLGWEIQGSVAFLLICVLVASILIWLVMHWLYAIVTLPSSIRRERKRLLSDKGLEYMTQALIASSEQDEKAAQKHLERARHYLPDSPLPRLLHLQLAGRKQDKPLAQKQFLQLKQFSSTKALALRGLAEQARLAGKMDEALTHVEALMEAAPHQPSTQKLAVDVYSYHRRWQEAARILKKARANRHISKDEYQRAAAALAMQQATIMLGEKNRQGAMELLRKATQTDPGFQPAVIKYAELLKQIGKTNQAIKLVRKAWKYAPHPQLVEAHQQLYTEASPEKLAKKMQELAKQNPDAQESQIVLAQAAMQQREWDSAKNHLKIALSKQQTISLCRMMAQLYKQGYHDELEERRWLEKAVTAIPDPSWHCTHCGAEPDEWTPHCPNCHDFATLLWQPERPMTA